MEGAGLDMRHLHLDNFRCPPHQDLSMKTPTLVSLIHTTSIWDSTLICLQLGISQIPTMMIPLYMIIILGIGEHIVEIKYKSSMVWHASEPSAYECIRALLLQIKENIHVREQS